MARPLLDSPYLYGIHDPGGEHLMAERGTPGWILFTEALGSDPNDQRGADYTRWSNAGFGIIARLNNGYEPGGTIPASSQYGQFARRVANFVRASRGCHIWIIGNEMNFAVERPGVVLDWSSNPPRIINPGEVILPSLYAACYTACRNAIKALPGHSGDQVITGAVAPWNIQTTYRENPTGDWVRYQTDLLAALGPKGCDGISIHAYTHGADPALVHSTAKMDPPFDKRHYHFRTYQDFMNGIPANMRHLPVYLTETDQNDAWQDVNRGWIQRAYGEIDWWNRQPGTQVIRAVILYRWPMIDRWGFERKTALHEDFRQAMVHKYSWEAAMQTKPQTQPAPVQTTTVKKPEFKDISSTLPRDASGFARRTQADIKYVVINHTAVRSEIGADRVAIAQRQRWPGIMSQFYITGDGQIQRTNPDTDAVTRDQSWIYNGIQIYVAGNFDAAVPSDRQLAALAHLCAWLLDLYDLKPDALRGASEFIQTHSPGLQWLQGARWKDKLLALMAAVPGSPVPANADDVKQLQAQLARLQAQIQTLTEQGKQLAADKTALAAQIQTLQSQNAALSAQAKALNEANLTLTARLKESEAEREELQKQVAELQKRIAELTKTPSLKPPAIRDVINTLPRHATNRYETRSLGTITTLAIHHSAASGDIPPQNVARYHVSRDWPGMGYHYYITSDGVIHQCNKLESIAYHSGYANTYSVGICLAGLFMNGATPTEKQYASVAHLIAYLSQQLNIRLENIKGHKELPQTATACPGSDWITGKRWKDQLLEKVKEKLG